MFDIDIIVTLKKEYKEELKKEYIKGLIYSLVEEIQIHTGETFQQILDKFPPEGFLMTKIKENPKRYVDIHVLKFEEPSSTKNKDTA